MAERSKRYRGFMLKVTKSREHMRGDITLAPTDFVLFEGRLDDVRKTSVAMRVLQKMVDSFISEPVFFLKLHGLRKLYARKELLPLELADVERQIEALEQLLKWRA